MTLEITVYTALNNVATWVNQKRTDLPCINLIIPKYLCVYVVCLTKNATGMIILKQFGNLHTLH